MNKVSWGVISTAKIGTEKVIPAMQNGKYCEIKTIASMDYNKAKKAADKLGIPKAYGSYEELLKDSEIQAVYIPLPNHLHVEWSIRSLRSGKHVLCEKPLGMNYKETETLYKVATEISKLKVMEAFMYRHHPQIKKTKELIVAGTIGELKNIHATFSYYNVDPQNIRNMADIGGGGLMDIGCYCISISRFLFGSEPKRVCASMDFDPQMKVDRFVSAVLEFKDGAANISCSTQLRFHQFAEIIGTKGKIRIDFPFTPAPETPAKITVQTDSDPEEISFEICNQYTIQGDLFSKAILDDTDVPTSFEDGIANMKVIDAIRESSKANTWIDLDKL